MEVVVPSPTSSPPMDPFDFNRAGISPYLSAPSSPKRFGDQEYYNNYLSAPSSPSRFFAQFDYFSSSPNDWNQNPDTPDDNDDGFAFFVSSESEKPSRSAEELFDGGKIKPLKEDELLGMESAKSPLLVSRAQPKKSSPLAQGKKVIREAFSPKKKKDSESEERRGRDSSSLDSSRRVTRSLSPYRISHYTWDEETQTQQPRSNKEDSNSNSVVAVPSLSSTSSSSKSSRKWRLRDFLLFRSASEGRGTSKDPFRKYPIVYKKSESSVRGGTSDIPKPRKKEQVSAHELHYARKKAESEDLKKRTFLPYKQGILGRLAGFGSNR